MRLTIIAIGKARKGPENDLFKVFADRVLWPITLIDVEERRPSSPAERVQREGQLLLSRIPDGAMVVALDGGGKTLSSEAFAACLGRYRDDGISDVAFIIGGADGLDPAIINKADLVLSLGAMTWPHQMVRAMIGEQIYRGQEVLAGHPYHRAGPPPVSGKKPGKTR